MPCEYVFQGVEQVKVNSSAFLLRQGFDTDTPFSVIKFPLKLDLCHLSLLNQVSLMASSGLSVDCDWQPLVGNRILNPF